MCVSLRDYRSTSCTAEILPHCTRCQVCTPVPVEPVCPFERQHLQALFLYISSATGRKEKKDRFHRLARQRKTGMPSPQGATATSGLPETAAQPTVSRTVPVFRMTLRDRHGSFLYMAAVPQVLRPVLHPSPTTCQAIHPAGQRQGNQKKGWIQTQ